MPDIFDMESALLNHMIADICEAGCDEAGRGCLCGPVCAAAVILPQDFVCSQLNDSKQLSEKRRDQLRPIIEESALAWAVAMVSPQEIDEINILNASILAMHRALDAIIEKYGIYPQHIIVDGNKFKPYHDILHHTVVKGDAKFMSIAAASILAKTHRDEEMRRLARLYPGYGMEKHMGYPTQQHRQAIKNLGLTPIHRRSFGPCKELL